VRTSISEEKAGSELCSPQVVHHAAELKLWLGSAYPEIAEEGAGWMRKKLSLQSVHVARFTGVLPRERAFCCQLVKLESD
jgi:hypothetical protein